MDRERIKLIRNFSIIAHVDHGKSTLADRIIEKTRFRDLRRKLNRILDSLSLEQQRGITIKLNTVALEYESKRTGETYKLNLIDTPGHADFRYEVSRSLAACEGVILLIDSTKGIQAQTLAYFQIAKRLNLDFIPVINKIDLPFAQIEKTNLQIKELFKDDQKVSEKEPILISSKTGEGMDLLMEEILERIESPTEKEESLKALVFDLVYNRHEGVIVYIRIFDGSLKAKDKVKLSYSTKIFEIEKVGIKNPEYEKREILLSGEIGWFTARIKDMKDVRVGDTVSLEKSTIIPLKGYEQLKSNIYSNFYPEDPEQYKELKKATEELMIQDGSFETEPIESNLLGPGFRCGFLGVLHQEIIQERIRQEFEIEVIATPPSTTYKIITNDGKEIELSNPQKFPSYSHVKEIKELFITITITTPEQYLGDINELCRGKRGIFAGSEIEAGGLWEIKYRIPFAEFIFDFNDRIKSISQGYASFDYEIDKFESSKIVKIDILLNGEPVNDLSFLVHQTFAHKRSKEICERLKDTLSQQNFEIPIQACIGKKIIARETLKPLRKDVIGKCYGGDVTRKKKLLNKQKKGKEKMKKLGKVRFSQFSLRNVLKKSKN